MKYSLNLVHLYPKNLNLYGDRGNIIVLKQRCGWHGIDLQLNELNIGDNHKPEITDIYFMGGGQDSDEISVVDDFHNLKAEAVKKDTENGVVFLGVCGGYQLMGRTFLTGTGKTIKGLRIIDVETKAPGTEVKQRCIGNLIAEVEELTYQRIRKIYLDENTEIPRTLVGFENHIGQTYLVGENVRPLAKTISGFGNNYSRKTEGAIYKNVFGSYMHGSFLPKNPHMADYLIWLALANKYKTESLKLNKLNDEVEYLAHKSILKRFLKH